MCSASRDRILSRLHTAPKGAWNSVETENRAVVSGLAIEEKIECLKQLMEGMRTEVHVVSDSLWINAFADIVRKKGLGKLLYSPQTEIGKTLEKYWKRQKDKESSLPELISCGENAEGLKELLFGVDAAITTTKGAIADAGAIILWPNEYEPRLMSLAPPVHFALLDADTIYHTLSEAMEKERWHVKMPTNALLVSGPSKTADIELTLAFGVHGPKELILFIITH